MTALLKTAIERINSQHSTAIKKKASRGSVREIELLWKTRIEDRWKLMISLFTERDRGNIRDLLKRYDSHTVVSLMEWAVENWKSLVNLPYMRLPPLPVFADFYYNRERIVAAWEENRRTPPRVYFNDAQPEKPEEYKPPTRTLAEIIAEERAKAKNK